VSGAPAWMKRLARDNARLYPRNGGAAGYGVWIGSDKRRRPLARLGEVEMRQALAAGVVEPGADGFRLSEDGRSQLRRQQAETDCPHAEQHRLMATRKILDPEGVLASAQFNLNENPLCRWRHHFSRDEINASTRFRADYSHATMSQRVTRSWSTTALQGCSAGRQSVDDARASTIAAKQRVQAALNCLGKGMGQVVMAICIEEENMSALERCFGWVERSGKSFLKMALQRLVEHYKI
jgi:hypothetical protein